MWQYCSYPISHSFIQFMFISSIRMGVKNLISGPLFVAWYLGPYQESWALLKVMISWDFHAQQSLEFLLTMVPKTKNILWAEVPWMETPCWFYRWEKNSHTGWSWQKGYVNSDDQSLQLCWAKKHLRMNNMNNLEVDGPQQQKTKLGSTPVSQDQRSEAAVDTGSTKPNSWRMI